MYSRSIIITTQFPFGFSHSKVYWVRGPYWFLLGDRMFDTPGLDITQLIDLLCPQLLYRFTHYAGITLYNVNMNVSAKF